MRNIKITALLLAVLMVVTAFAGCASKSAVSDLDNKVQEQANALAGIQESLKDLAAAIEDDKGSSELDDIKADVEANKQSVADILAAIEGLKDAVAGATGESEDVKTAVNQAGAKIDALKEAYAENKEHYSAEDYAAIVATLGAAQAAISTCVTAEAVAAVLATMEADLAKCVRVNDALYAYVVELKGNITAATEEKVEEAMAALEEALEFYEDAETNEDGEPVALAEYGEDEDINLIDEINDLYTAQTVDLVNVTARAKQLVKDINAAAEAYEVGDLYDLLAEYKSWSKVAKKLSPENVALVTNYDKLTAALDEAQNVETAKRELLTAVWEYESILTETEENMFFDYLLLVAAAEDEEIGVGLQALYALPVYDEDGKLEKLLKVADIYKAIDARVAEFKAEYELSDEALEYVVTFVMDDEHFLEKYEADKALAADLAAEYDVLNKGVFAAIKSLNSKKVSAANALELVNAFEKNAKDIVAWKDALIKAYAAEYAEVEDAALVRNYAVADYTALLEITFNVMVIEGKLCAYDAENKTYAPYPYGFDTTEVANKSFLALYDFTKNAATETFITETYPQVKIDAELINGRITAFQANQAISIEKLVTVIGGYVKYNEDGDELVAVVTDPEENADFGAVIDTIAEFVAEYDELGLAGMVNVELYNEKLATVEKNIEKAEAALKALMNAYGKLLGNKSTVVVTMDNVAEVKALEALLINWNKAGRSDMVKAVAADTTAAGVQEYKLVGIIADYVKTFGADFAAEILDATDYNLTTSTKGTGAIVRLIHKAKALEKEATYVESAYKMMKALNDATGGKAFAYSTLNDAAALLANISNVSTTDGYLYGILGFDIAEKTVDGVTTYKASAKMIRFDAASGFRQGTLSDNAYHADKTTAMKKAIAAVKGQWVYGVTNPTVADFYSKIFVDLVADIKNTDSEDLTDLLGNGTKVIPGYALPMLAMYLEAKFEINNMGKAYEPIETAKAGWGTVANNYGFDYIKAMVVNQLRTEEGTKITSSSLSAIGNTIDYNELTVAVNNTLEALEDGFGSDIAFGHADAEWLADSYNLEVVKNADGSLADGVADAYAEHEIDLDKLAVDVISIYVDETEA